MKTQYQIEQEVQKRAKMDLISQFTGMLSAALPVLTILGISLDWFTQDFIDNLYLFLAALVPFMVNLFTIYKNHFTRKDSQEKLKKLKEEGLE